MILALLLLGAPQSAPVREFFDPQLAIERVSRCGLGRPGTRYDKDMQSDVLVLRRPTRASDEQLACIDKASGYFEVELSPALQSRFYAISIARRTEGMKLRAREWLSAHNLLDRLPHYRRGEGSQIEFARSLERLCGPDAADALDPAENGHSFSRQWIAAQKPDAPNDAATCLFHAALVSGFPLGFVGNDVVR